MTTEPLFPSIEIPEPIRAERRRQVEREGWTAEHDDAHADGELVAAAMCYFRQATGELRTIRRPEMQGPRSVMVTVPVGWPWNARWWKPRDPRRDLERAGALILADAARQRRFDPACSLAHSAARLRRVCDAYRRLGA